MVTGRVQCRMAAWEAGRTSGSSPFLREEEGLTLGVNTNKHSPNPSHVQWVCISFNPEKSATPESLCVCVCLSVCLSTMTCRALPLTVLQFLTLVSAPLPTLTSHTFKKQEEGFSSTSEGRALPLLSLYFLCTIQPRVSSDFFYTCV